MAGKVFDRIGDAIRWLEFHGLVVERGGRGGHFKVYHQERMIGVISKNMDDARGWRNQLSRMRRASGLRLRG